MSQEAVEGLLRGAVTAAGIAAQQLFGRGEERPSPAVFAVVFIDGIDKVFGDDAAGHLQAGDVAVEAAAHLRTGKATGGPQFTGDEAAVLSEREQDGLFDGAFLRGGILMAAVVAEVRPPVAADEPCLAGEELPIDAMALCDDGAFPLP